MREIDHAGQSGGKRRAVPSCFYEICRVTYLSLSAPVSYSSLTKSTTFVTINDGLDNFKTVVNASGWRLYPAQCWPRCRINADSASWIERCHAQHFIQRDAAMRDQSCVRLQSWL